MVVASERFSADGASTSTGGCTIGGKLFVGLETVTMTICDTAPAIGDAVSTRATPVGARLTETSWGARDPSGGRMVAATPSVPLTRCARAVAGMVASTMLTVASNTEIFASEYVRMLHR